MIGKKAISITLLIIGAMILAGCIHPYHVDVQQGNIIEQETLSQLHKGLSKGQVEDLLGTPVLNNTLDENRWCYVYTNQINGGKITNKRVELRFKENKLVEIKQS